MRYYALAFYTFKPIEDPHYEVEKHKVFFEGRDITSRIYISEEGINGQMSGSIAAAEAYMQWLRQDPRFSDITFKIHEIEENIFPRQTVKYRKQIVALDEPCNAAEGGKHVSPTEWKEMLKSREYLILDVRNDYEWEVGHFEGATCPPLKKFRDFPGYADQLAQEHEPKKTKVMMYCTGGIRCELYSALMKKRGFDEIYQLDGGVINYGFKEGQEGWKGKLFVFDDRLAIPISKEEAAPIAQCRFCDAKSDTYYNCANMDCNTLFICCADCLEEQKGCCQASCSEAPRLRTFDASRGNKPFRRKSCGCN